MLNKTNLARIDLNLLVLFEVVLEERHVGRAAARLNVSPSAVSHGLGRLRELMQDPLFLRQPKGVVPTERARQLAAPVADILERTRQVIARADKFDPRHSVRRFVIGAPDAVTAVLLPGLLAELQHEAPGIDLGVRNLVGQFDAAFAELDQRTLDVALLPVSETPARFVTRTVFEEEGFVVVRRAGHPMGRKLTLARYCAASHVVVSVSGDPHGLVDRALANAGAVPARGAHGVQLHQCAGHRRGIGLVGSHATTLRHPVRQALRRRERRAAGAAQQRAHSGDRPPGGHHGRRPGLATRSAGANRQGLGSQASRIGLNPP